MALRHMSALLPITSPRQTVRSLIPSQLHDRRTWTSASSSSKPNPSNKGLPAVKTTEAGEEGASSNEVTSGSTKENEDEIVARHSKASTASPPSDGSMGERELHNEIQATFFDQNSDFFVKPVPPAIEEKVAEIVAAARVGPGCKVLDCGAGSGALIPHLHSAGVTDITAVDLSLMMIAQLKERFDEVCCWHGDIVDQPSEDFGPFDAIFFNAMFGNVHSQSETLAAAVRLSKPGGRVVISHPLGAAFVGRLREESPQVVPHPLPNRTALEEMTADLPVDILELRDEPEFYSAVLQVRNVPQDSTNGSPRPEPGTTKEEYSFWKAPLYLKGPVVAGFGRGSRQMGVPTANLPPVQLEEELAGVEKGVYFGLAQLPLQDSCVYKMVMNVGQRPTFVDGDGLSVEVHILHKFSEDFYGQPMRAVVLGFIRPELKFGSLDELVGRIRTDINIADAELDKDAYRVYIEDPFFQE